MSFRLDLLAPAFRDDPYPFYARMRREAPVSQVEPLGLWAVSRYEDALHVLQHPELFSSRGILAASEPAWLGRSNPVSESFMALDPPRHTHLRALVSRAFTPTAVSRLELFVRGVVEQLVPRLLTSSPVDFVTAFSLPLPSRVMAELLGLDSALSGRFKQWTDDIITAAALPPEAVEAQQRVRDTLSEMDRYFQEIIESRRRQPGDDMVSVLMQVQVEGRAVTEQELRGFFYLLLISGLETTMHLLSHGVLSLARYPEVQARVRAEPELLPRFIEEVLRCEPPVHSTLRVTLAETELSGVRLPPGTPLLVLLASAQRDERLLADADQFSIDRPEQTHLAFGHGIHLCLGAPLARLEARVALETLLAHSRSLHVDFRDIQWNRAPTARGPVKLPTRWEPA